MTCITEAQQTLIRLLADGNCHSGEEIGQYLGVSRAAVWKQLQKLSDYGLEVVSLKGRGYHLSRKIDLLDEVLIKEGLSESVDGHIDRLDIPFSVDSTNSYVVKEPFILKENKANICLSEFQSEGRGRRGRRWMSPLGCNLYASFLWQFEAGASVLEGLSLAVGVVIAKTLKRLGVDAVKLKWPNDILLGEKKLGGILLEMTGDPAGCCQVIVGVGINVAMPRNQVEIDQPWVALNEVLPGVSRNQLSVEMINEIMGLLVSYEKEGFAAYIEDWEALDAFSGQVVSVISGSKTTQGIAAGVAENGALMLDVDGVKQPFYGGELSLRLDKEVVPQ